VIILLFLKRKNEVAEIEKQLINDEKTNLSKRNPGFERIYGITGFLYMFLFNSACSVKSYFFICTYVNSLVRLRFIV